MRQLVVAVSLLTAVYLYYPAKAAQQHNFRSILVQRACEKHPALEFCQNQATEEATTKQPKTERADVGVNEHPKLVLPPHADVHVLGAPPPLPRELKTTTPHPVKTTVPRHEDEHFGSLLRLPKPRNLSAEKTTKHSVPMPPTPTTSSPHEVEQHTVMHAKQREEKKIHMKTAEVESPKEAVREMTNATKEMREHVKTDEEQHSVNKTENIANVTAEDDKSVLVFVSQFCVVERERFVRKCHGEVDKKELVFCQSYLSACASTKGVLPVISYCQRYFKHYPKHCATHPIAEDHMQFCFAFEHFCLPELTPAVQHATTTSSPAAAPKSSLKRCEDIVHEAKKVCNPFPQANDTFNVLRCSQFLANCRKFVDWL